MELSLRLLHLPVDGSPVTRELGQSGPSPVSRTITQDQMADTDFRIDGARADRRTSVRARRDRECQKRRQRSARILIVDGEPAAAEAVRDHLLGCGHTVDMAFSADDALTAVQRAHRDVVLLDSWTPEVDGVEGLRRIRALDSTVPVIIVTANADVGLKREALKFGACGYVMKPIDFANLDRAIASLLISRDAKGARTPWR